MSTYVLIPGAGCGPKYWRLLDAELRKRGHDVVPVDLPCDDDSAGLEEYAATTTEQIGDRIDLVIVAHSFGGFTAPLVCDRVEVDLLVMLSAMIPSPGEAPGDWWTNTGYKAEYEDINAAFFSGVPADLVAETLEDERDQSGRPTEQPWPLRAWPDVPTRVLLCRDELFLPAHFMRRVARERLGITPDEIPGGHMAMLSHPALLADRLTALAADPNRRT